MIPPSLPPVRAAHQLWHDSLYEVQTVDTSREMGDMARRLRRGGEEKEEEEGGGEKEEEEEGGREEKIPGVYFRQYLPTSDMVWSYGGMRMELCPNVCVCVHV